MPLALSAQDRAEAWQVLRRQREGKSDASLDDLHQLSIADGGGRFKIADRENEMWGAAAASTVFALELRLTYVRS